MAGRIGHRHYDAVTEQVAEHECLVQVIAPALRQFIEHAQSIEGVSFMRRCDIASWWLEHYPPR